VTFESEHYSAAVPTPSPTSHVPCTPVQQAVLKSCLSDADNCIFHLEDYKAVVGGCYDGAADPRAGGAAESATSMMDKATGLIAAAAALPPPPPPSCGPDMVQSSFQAIESACCTGVRTTAPPRRPR
jgi:hypothetical protein